MAKYNDERMNFSGCRDTTAYSAMQNIRRDERRKLIAALKAVASSHGYRIVSTIKLKEMDGDKF